MPAYMCPGLYLEQAHSVSVPETPTGVPVFLGYTRRDGAACSLAHWSQFQERFGEPPGHGYLAQAVRGFFENGGKLCYVVPLKLAVEPVEALRAALQASAEMEEADLLCAPDLLVDRSGHPLELDAAVALQATLLHPGPGSEERSRRFVILDSLPGADPSAEIRHCHALIKAVRKRGGNPADLSGAALYYPWIAVSRVAAGTERTSAGTRVDTVLAPPCGHVAGIYARTDAAYGVRKAPANEVLHGVLDLAAAVTEEEQASFFSSEPSGAVNCLRAFPGRGIRIWGARTLSDDGEGRHAAEWRYVNVRRLFLQAIRWIDRKMAVMAFEPNGPDLWARIRRELNAYCYDLFQRGFLKGASTNEAFFVRCDADLNPREAHDTVVAELGLAAARPYEFIVIRLVHRAGGTTTGGEGAASI